MLGSIPLLLLVGATICGLTPCQAQGLPDGITVTQLKLERKVSLISMVFLPDGRALALERAGNVYIMDADQMQVPVAE